MDILRHCLEGGNTTMDVRDRRSLWQSLHAAADGDASRVLDCLTAYTPPAERLILREASDFAALGVTPEEVHGAADEGFWAYADFHSVLASFAREPTDPERRVMGIEGVGSAAALREAIASGKRPLRIGHLSHTMLVGKVANGEWRWIDEASCVMHTATPKPALLRTAVRERLKLELRVLRHEKFLGEKSGEAAPAAPESVGDLIIFDIDVSDTVKPTGNTKVFCQDPKGYQLSAYASLPEAMREAVNGMLARELAA